MYKQETHKENNINEQEHKNNETTNNYKYEQKDFHQWVCCPADSPGEGPFPAALRTAPVLYRLYIYIYMYIYI